MAKTKGLIYGIAALGLALGACSGDDNEDIDVPRTSADGTVKEYAITLPQQSVPAGEVMLGIANQGSEEHSLVLARTETPLAGLPVKKGKVESGKLEVEGKLRSLEPNSTGSRLFELKAGRYVLYCEKEGHYERGMRIELVAE